MMQPDSTALGSAPAKRRRWYLQFSVRSLLALMLLACALMGWWRWVVHSYEKQHAAREKIGRITTVIGTEPGRPAWLRPLFDSEVFQDVVKVSFDGSGRLSDDDLAPLANFSRLRRLSLDGTALTDKGLAHLANLTELDTLSLNDTWITSAGLVHVRDLKNLKHLELGHTKIDGSGLAHLSGLKHLEVLELNELPINDDHLLALESLGELKTLWLQGTQIRGPGLERLANLQRLIEIHVSSEHLSEVRWRSMPSLQLADVSGALFGKAQFSIEDCPSLVTLELPVGFARIDLTDLPRLKNFDLNALPDVVRRQLSAEGRNLQWEPVEVSVNLRNIPSLVHVHVSTLGILSLTTEKMPALRNLSLYAQELREIRCLELAQLDELTLHHGRIHDSAMPGLRQLPNVRQLALYFPKSHAEVLKHLPLDRIESLHITNRGEAVSPLTFDEIAFARLSKSRTLRQIHLSGANIRGPELRPLTSHSEFEKLEVSHCRLENGALRHIGRLTSLRELSFRNTPVDDEEIQALSQLHQLHKLIFDNAAISEEAFVHFYCLPELRHLEMAGVMKATKEEFRELSTALPEECELRIWERFFGRFSQHPKMVLKGGHALEIPPMPNRW